MNVKKNVIISIFIFYTIFLFSVFLNNTNKTFENFNGHCFSAIEKISKSNLSFLGYDNKFNISHRKNNSTIAKSDNNNSSGIDHCFKKNFNSLVFVYLIQYKKIKLNKNIKLSFFNFEIQPNAP